MVLQNATSKIGLKKSVHLKPQQAFQQECDVFILYDGVKIGRDLFLSSPLAGNLEQSKRRGGKRRKDLSSMKHIANDLIKALMCGLGNPDLGASMSMLKGMQIRSPSRHLWARRMRSTRRAAIRIQICERYASSRFMW